MYRDSKLSKNIKHFNNKKRRSHEREVMKEAEKAIDQDDISGVDYEKKEDPWAWD